MHISSDLFSKNGSWISHVVDGLPHFVDSMSCPGVPGRYRYSYSGDLSKANEKFGLASSTFAARVLFILGKLSTAHKKDISKYILSFSTDDTFIFDPTVLKNSRWSRIKQIIRGDLSYLSSKPGKIAETRQAVAALHNLGSISGFDAGFVIFEQHWIANYIDGLDWSKPWGAASYVNHLLFFIYVSDCLNSKEKVFLVDMIYRQICKYHKKDGFFYRGRKPSDEQNIGSTMKLIMGFALFSKHEQLLDKAVLIQILNNLTDLDACQTFNPLFVLEKYFKFFPEFNDQIIETTLTKVLDWQEFYWPDYGGFSFTRGFSGKNYLGARVSMGLPEPDLHGTAMFTWGLLIANEIIGSLDVKLNQPLL